jgi:type IV secretion system protein VirB2
MNRSRRFALIHRANRYTGTLTLLAAAAALLALPEMAFAGLPDIAGKANTIATWLASAGLAVLTGAVTWTGYRVLFQGAQFQSLSNIFWGGILIGGAALIAAFAFGG